jgi:hypothetical protein
VKSAQDVQWYKDVFGCLDSVPPPGHQMSLWEDQTVMVSKHLCGSGIDHLLRSLERSNFWPRLLVLSSCCHNKSSPWEYVNHPYLQTLLQCDNQDNHQDWQTLTNKTSWLQEERQPWMIQMATLLESLLDHGRVMWLRENGNSKLAPSGREGGSWMASAPAREEHDLSVEEHRFLAEGRKRGYACCRMEFVSSHITPRNKVLVAWRRGGLLAPLSLD